MRYSTLLSAPVFLVTAPEEAGVRYQRDSAYVIVTLDVLALFCIAFLALSGETLAHSATRASVSLEICEESDLHWAPGVPTPSI